MKLFRSVLAVGAGVVMALLVALLVVFGILWPLFTVFAGGGQFGLEMAAPTALPMALIVLATAFAFYWGGMFASYRAPGRRRLHGTLVAPAAFAVSPLVNLLTGQDPVPALASAPSALLLALVSAVSVVGAYVGARRGAKLYAHNRRYARALELSRRDRARKAQAKADPRNPADGGAPEQ